MLKKLTAFVATGLLAVAALTVSAPAASAAPSGSSVQTSAGKVAAGAKCTKAKSTAKTGKTSLVCRKNAAGKLVWTRTSTASLSRPLVSVPAATPSATPVPAPTAAGTSPSGFPIVTDPNAGGSNEVDYGDPVQAEQPVVSAPVAVSGISASLITDNSAVISFTPVAGVDVYQVYIRYDDSYTLKGVAGSTPTVTFTELTADWQYTACVYYFDSNSVMSNKACVDVHTTGSRPVEPVKPLGPSSLALRATENTISASWAPVAGATWYSLCHIRGDSGQCGGYTMLTDTSAIWQDNSVFAGYDYKVTIQAVFADGSRSQETVDWVTSAGSQPAPPSKYSAPTNLHITDLTPTKVSFAWNAPAGANITLWQVLVRHLTSYTATGVDGATTQFTSDGVIWAGAGFELIVYGYDAAGKATEEARLGFYAPTN